MTIDESKNIFKDLKSGENIFVHTAVCSPQYLLKLLVEEIKERKLENISIYHLHIEGEAPHVAPEVFSQIHTKCFFVGANCRKAVQSGKASYIPVFLSEIPRLFKNKVISLDWCLVQISPFDKHGLATLGPSVDVTLTAIHTAKRVVAQVNKNIPRVLGDGIIHKKNIHNLIYLDSPLPEVINSEITHEIAQIGKNVASLIEDGSTLQMGIGTIPNAVLNNLKSHKHLGVHTEMFSDGIVELVNNGAIDNSLKKIHPHKIVSSFAMGSKDFYNFLDDNPLLQFMGSEFVNDPRIIQKNPKVCAINSAIEIDLTGQACADSIGHKVYSGVGGQVDFLRGATLSQGGKAILAFESVTSKGASKIVTALKPGAGVVSSRAHVRFVVTEWGIADLQGKSLAERVQLLVSIAHPNHRDQLLKEAKELVLY